MSPQFWGQGLATEATKEMLNFAFEKLFIMKVYAHCLAENKGILRVLEKAGMKKEKMTKGGQIMKGREWDVLTLSIQNERWIKEKEKDLFS